MILHNGILVNDTVKIWSHYIFITTNIFDKVR